MPKTAYRPALFVLVACAAFLSGGCTSDPKGQASEIRALYNEAQVQVGELCKDPNTNPAKCADLKAKIAEAAPFIDALEVAASAADKDPTKFLTFQQLWVEYKPKVQSILISIVVRRYLGG